MRRHAHLLCAVLLVVAVWMLAPQRAAAQYRPEVIFDQARQLEAARLGGQVQTHLARGLFDRQLNRVDQLLEELDQRGFDFYLLYGTTYQQGSQGPPDNHTFNHSLNLFLDWYAVDDPQWGQGTLGVYFLQQAQYLSTSTVDFGRAMGTTILPNTIYEDSATSLAGLWWEHVLPGGLVEVTFGQIDPILFFDTNDYAGWDLESFMAEPLAGNSVRAFPEPNPGIIFQLNVTGELAMSASIMAANARGTNPNAPQSMPADYAYFYEIWYYPTIPGWGPGKYRFTIQGIDESSAGPASTVFLWSCQQDLGDDWAWFLRAGSGDGRRSPVKNMASSGFVWKQPFGWSNDWLGLGAMWNDPSATDAHNEYGLEAFWRLQLTKYLQLTPDVQFLFDPGKTAARDFGVVGGLRLAFEQ